MSFDFSTLVTDRLQSDVEERNAKGTYNAADLNRVTAAMEELAGMLRALGYDIPGYRQIKIHESGGGEDEDGLTDGYIQLQYIESDGNQYIDAGFMPNQDTRVVMSAMITDITGASLAYFGTREESLPTAKESYSCWTMSTGTNISSDFFGGRVSQNLNTKNLPVLIDKDKNVCKVNDMICTNAEADGQATYPLYLLGCNDVGVFKYGSPIILYSCQIYDNGTLVRDFVPCKSPAGETGLYDKLNGVFYGNEGTGSFTAGAEIELDPRPEPTPGMDPYTWYERDIPLQEQMEQYLSNLKALRSVLVTAAQEILLPKDMALLTFGDANSIEEMLLALHAALSTVRSVFPRSGMSWIISGTSGFYIRN